MEIYIPFTASQGLLRSLALVPFLHLGSLCWHTLSPCHAAISLVLCSYEQKELSALEDCVIRLGSLG